MEQRLTVVTLGVADVERARRFYEALGWGASPASAGDIVYFALNGLVLSLYPRHLLAEDAQVEDVASGWRAVTLAHSVRSKAEADAAMETEVACPTLQQEQLTQHFSRAGR